MTLSPGRTCRFQMRHTVIIDNFLLSQQETTTEAKNQWIDAALQILSNITALAWVPAWQSLISNCTVNEPALTGIIYGL